MSTWKNFSDGEGAPAKLQVCRVPESAEAVRLRLCPAAWEYLCAQMDSAVFIEGRDRQAGASIDLTASLLSALLDALSELEAEGHHPWKR